MHLCPECDKKLATAGGLEIHMELAHKANAPAQVAPEAAPTAPQRIDVLPLEGEPPEEIHHRRDEMEAVGPEELLRRLETGEVTVLDVRPGVEYEQGHLPGARSIPVDELEGRIGKPVVTSTQATLWHVLRLAGVDTPVPGYGRLLREY